MIPEDSLVDARDERVIASVLSNENTWLTPRTDEFGAPLWDWE